MIRAFVAIFLLYSTLVHAADVFIRDGASGSGTSWSNALDDLPSDLTRGNTYWIADGSYADYLFDDIESGTTAITIRKATGAAHGTETGWVSTYGDGQATFPGMNFVRGYYTIDGATRNSANWRDVSAYGFRITGGIGANTAVWGTLGDNITIDYCDIGGTLSTSFNEGHPDSGIYIGGFASYADDWIVRRCHIHNVDIPMHLNGIDGWLIEYNHLGPGWSKETIRGQIFSANTVIRYNFLHDGCQSVDGDPPDGRVACTGQIAMWDGNAGGFDNIEIYGNVISVSSANTTTHTDGAILVGSASPGPTANNCKIYNNTIVNIDQDQAIIITSGTHTGVDVRNNIWYDCSAGTGVSGANTSSNNSVIATNIFVSPTSSPPNMRLTEATSAGFSLSSPYNTDVDGTTRGGDGVWDIGAFEFDGGVTETTMNVVTFTIGVP